MGTDDPHGWENLEHSSAQQPRVFSQLAATGHGHGYVDVQASNAAGFERPPRDKEDSATGGLESPLESPSGPSEHGAGHSKDLSHLLESYKELRANILVLRQAIHDAHTDLQHRRQICQNRYRFYHQATLDLCRVLKSENDGAEAIDIAAVSRLEADYKDLTNESNSVAELESKLSDQLHHLQRLESEEEKASTYLLHSAGINVPPAGGASAHGEDVNTPTVKEITHSVASSISMHPVLRDFYSKSGDVGILIERLVDLEALQIEELEARDILRDQDQPLVVSDEDFQQKQSLDVERLRKELDTAKVEMNLARTMCEALGLEIERHEQQSNSSAAEDEADSGSVAIYETIVSPSGISSHFLMRAERVPSTSCTGPLEGSQSPVRRTAAERVRTQRRIEEWVQDVEPSSFASMPLVEHPATLFPPLEPLMDASVEPQPIGRVRAGSGASHITIQPKPANERDTMISDHSAHPASSAPELGCAQADDLEQSMSPTASLTRQSTGFIDKPNTALSHAKEQIKCPITRLMRRLARRYKSRKLP